MKKRILCMILAFVLLGTRVYAAPKEQEATVTLSAGSAILIDAQSGAVLFEADADEPMPPASITKIMTMLLVLEAIGRGECSMSDTVTASAHAVSMGGSQIWLKENEQMTVEELFKATAIGSANDAAMALAEHIAGSEEAFVALMNARAKELGMENTVFKNPTGLDAEGHVSTARDIALMSKALLTHEEARKYSSVWMDSLRGGATQLVNTNKLVRFYEGCIGLKTGTTDGAGSCLSAAAERNGLTLISVVMHCPTSKERFADARKLLDFGFANWCTYTPKLSADDLPGVAVHGGVTEELKVNLETAPVLIKKSDANAVEETFTLPKEVEAPVIEGAVLGEMTVKAGEAVHTFPLTAAFSVPKLDFWAAFGLLGAKLIGNP